MLIDQLFGGLEIEERRPRTWNEPRRKRLRFVKGGTRRPEEWQLIHSTQPPHTQLAQRPTQVDMWDRRQADVHGSFLHHERLREMERIRAEQQIFQLRNPIPHPQLQHQQQHGEGFHDSRQTPLPPRDHHRPDNHNHGHQVDEVEILSNEPSSESEDDGQYSVKYRLIEPARHEKLPKEYHHKRSKSKGRKEKTKKKYKKRPTSYDSDSSDSELSLTDVAVVGLKMARKAEDRGRSRSRSRSVRRHYYNNLSDDDSFVGSPPPRFRLRSKSRGPRFRGYH